jgi:hypothetical protein
MQMDFDRLQELVTTVGKDKLVRVVCDSVYEEARQPT